MLDRTASRRAFLPVACLVAILMIAAPVLGADPGEKPAKAEKTPEIARTLTGTVSSADDAKGRPTFTMTVGGVTWELSAGPKWFWGADNPLAAYIGKSVEVSGTYHAGETELDVDTIDGKALRTRGKPPWAGGPRVVGKSHPGWKDGKPGKAGKGQGHGREHAPGQLKDKTETSSAD